ncbi:MAG: hypothetical protein H6719_15075 [Sandaracinaceae bacterium]|nr:hypothetical protein [Sandaracinaceae bacterium]
MSHSPIRDLVGRSLTPIHEPGGIIDTSETYLSLFDGAAAVGAEAIAGSGVGSDHFAGERILASVLYRDTPKGHEHRLSLAITDRRTALSGWSSISGPMTFNEKRGSVLHAELTGVEVKSSLLSNKITLRHARGALELTFGEANAPLGAFFQAIGSIPPQHRGEPPTPFVTPSEPDPTGASAAAAGLFVEDHEARSMLGQVAASAAQGNLDAAAGQDFVGRVLLAHRTRAGGPGMRDERWISPMSSQDLGHTLVRVFGQPTAHQQPQPGVEMLDFRIDPRRDYLGAAMTALGVASKITFGIGVSPGKAIANVLMKRREVTELRVLFADLPGCCAYRLFGHGVPVEQVDARVAQRIHEVLIASAYPVLARRAAYGWGVAYDALWSNG